jgi:hypothetical protein
MRVLTWKLFLQLSAPLIALAARAALWLFSLFFSAGLTHASFLDGLIYKTLSLSRRCARLVGKTTATPLAKGRCSIQRELVETLANENRSFVAKIILLLFQMLAREGLHGQLSYIRTVDLFVSF